MSAIEYFISLCEECNERAYICITLLSVVDQREHEQRVAVRAEFLQFCDYMNGECFCVECICAFYGCFVLHRICHETKSERERENNCSPRFICWLCQQSRFSLEYSFHSTAFKHVVHGITCAIMLSPHTINTTSDKSIFCMWTDETVRRTYAFDDNRMTEKKNTNNFDENIKWIPEIVEAGNRRWRPKENDFPPSAEEGDERRTGIYSEKWEMGILCRCADRQLN